MDKDNKTTEASEINETVENLTIQGNCVFLIETVAAGIAVQTALLTEDKKIHLYYVKYFRNHKELTIVKWQRLSLFRMAVVCLIDKIAIK